MFDADDLAAFNDPDMPGYALASLGGIAVAGRMKLRPAESFDLVAGSLRYFSGSSAELAGVVVDSIVTIGSVDYRVQKIETPDPMASGMTLLVLK